MATQTTNLKLVKPEMSDYADIRDFSNNFEILDKAYGYLNDKYLLLAGDTMTSNIGSSNAVAELQRVNNQLNELNAAAACVESIDGEDMYTIFRDGQVITMTNDELNEYHDTLTDRRLELLKTLQA